MQIGKSQKDVLERPVRVLMAGCSALAMMATGAANAKPEQASLSYYQIVAVDGLSIFYRGAGSVARRGAKM